MSLQKNKMKLRITLLIISILSFLNIYSQAKKVKQELSFNEGVAIPIGSFGANELSRKNAGFASAGEFTEIEYKSFIWGTVALKGSFLTQINFINRSELVRQYEHLNPSFNANYSAPVFPQPYTVSQNNFFNRAVNTDNSTGSLNRSWSFKRCSWKLFAVTGGPVIKINMDKVQKLFFETSVEAGVGYLISPSLNAAFKNDTVSARINQTSKGGFGFVYSADAGLQYKFHKKIQFQFGIHLLGSGNFNFKNVKTTLVGSKGSPYSLGSLQSWSSETTGTVKQPISNLNFSAGLSFCL